LFYWVVCDDLPWTWVYDVSEQLWHKRAIWNTDTAVWMPYVAGSHMFAFGKHLVGDRATDTIYELSSAFYDDQVASS
jgi:hypothetical protein